MYTSDRQAYRDSFVQAWHKYKHGLHLSPIEILLKEVLLEHPEYIDYLENNSQDDFTLTDNPFFHLGLHLALREQVNINRPAGISDVYRQLVERLKNPHEAEHAMMDCLTEMLWQAQQQKTLTDNDYLRLLKSLL